MADVKQAAGEDDALVPRIHSGHLSDQFQRELSSTGNDDLLENDLTIDDINSASGSGASAFTSLNTTPLSSPARPNLSPSIPGHRQPVTYSTSPFAAFSGNPSISNSNVNNAQDGRLPAGHGLNGTLRARGSSASKELSEAYRQPSKIPRLNSASSISQPPQQAAARQQSTAMDRRPSQGKEASRRTSGNVRTNSTALPSSSKPNLPKAPASIASRSLSDTSEELGQPVWKSSGRIPQPKYTRQRDKALGGPFERTSSSSAVPKPAGKGRAKGQGVPSRSSSTAQDMQRYRREHSQGRSEEPQLATDTTMSSTPVLSGPATPPLQAVPTAASAVDLPAEADPTPVQASAESRQQDSDASLEQPQEGLQTTGESLGGEGVGVPNGGQQLIGELQHDVAAAEPSLQGPESRKPSDDTISADHVALEVRQEIVPVEIKAQVRQGASGHALSEVEEAKLNKKAKCCACTIM